MLGKVCWYNKKIGYGYLTPLLDGIYNEDKNVFVHRRDLVGTRDLLPDEPVEFEIGEFSGRKTAIKVRRISKPEVIANE